MFHKTSSEHRRNKSLSAPLSPSQAKYTAVQDHGVVEYSKTSTFALSRLVTSLEPVFTRCEGRVNGSINHSYGLLLSTDSAFVFPYITSQTQPPILTFPLPRGESQLFGALVPGSGDDPGLLVVMPTKGKVGFWPALHSALAPQSGIEASIQLSSGENVTQVCNAGAAGLVASTNHGRMLHIALRDQAGKACVKLTSMSNGSGWLGTLASFSHLSSKRDIVAVKAGQAKSREEREILTITKRGLLNVWEVSRIGNHRLLLESDLSILLSSEGCVEVVDLVALPTDQNSVLVLILTNRNTRLLGIKFDKEARPFVGHRYDLPLLEVPKLHLPNPGFVAFISTLRSIHLISLVDAHVEALKFKDRVEIVVTGSEDAQRDKRNPGLIILARGAGVLRLEVFPTPLKKQNETKTEIEQAVFYGFLEGQPLSFENSLDAMDQATREVSYEILRGTSPYLPQSVSLADILGNRVSALDRLARYTSSKVKDTTKRVLRENIEKMVSTEYLWRSIDSRIESTAGDIFLQILSDLPSRSISKSQAKEKDDKARGFLLGHCEDIANVVLASHALAVEAAATLEAQPLSNVVSEVNEMVLATLTSAVKYRDEKYKTYGLEGDFWTSDMKIVNALSVQYDITYTLISGLQDGEGERMRDQLVGLSNLNCRINEDKIKSLSAGTERSTINQTYLSRRSHWIKKLVRVGRIEQAFDIGETYKDFQTLIEICHEQGQSASDEETVSSVTRRLEWYLHTFKYDFARVLWEYYIKNRQFWNLLHEFPDYRGYLTQFFIDSDYPNISWMNDIILGDYDKAGETLLRVKENHTQKRKIQLSIAKLALLVNENSIPEEVEYQIDYMDLLRNLESEVRLHCLGAIDAEAALELALKAMSSGTVLDTTRSQMETLLKGQTLEAGAAIDFLTTTKSAPDENHYFEALKVLYFVRTLPVAVHSMLEKTIWRRCFLADDWTKVVDTRGRSDSSVEADTKHTYFFKTVTACLSSQMIPPINLLHPKDAYFSETQIVPFSSMSKAELSQLRKAFEKENEQLDFYEANCNLGLWFEGITQSVQETILQAEDSDYVEVSKDDIMDV